MEETLTSRSAAAAADSPGGAPAPDGAADRPASLPLFVSDPSQPRPLLNLREIWEARELLHILVSRDLKVRYRQTALGVVWALLGPLLLVGVLTLFFGLLARMGPAHLPYAAWLVPGFVIWTYFDSAMRRASNCLVTSKALLTKVYFPRAVLPLASVVTPLVDLLFALVVVVILLAAYGMAPHSGALFSPLYLLLAAAAALGVGMGLGALNVRFRDVHHALPVLARLWFFCTPVIYASDLVPQRWRVLYAVNPMVSVVEGFRWGWVGTPAPTPAMVAVSSAAALALLAGGYLIFRRIEHTFTDVL
jgi:lipopolysaccharide transport system permease protein